MSSGTAFTCYAFVNVHDGLVTGHGEAAPYEAIPPGATVISGDHHATITAELAEQRQCRLVNGVLQHVPLPQAAPPSIEVLRETACAAVDGQAEAARLRFMTPGGGQRAEYEATAYEAALASSADDPLDADDYPHLQAEVLALRTIGIETTVRAVADAVLQLHARSAVAGAMIKQIRRAAKLQIGCAGSADAVAAVLDRLDWSQPPG